MTDDALRFAGAGRAENPARDKYLTWSHRFRGALLGGAVGDALGAGVRGRTTAEIQRWFGRSGTTDYLPIFGKRGAATELTQLTAFTMEALLRAKAVNADSSDWLPTPLVRANHLRWLYTQGVPWEFAMSGYLQAHPEPGGWLLERPELFSTRNPGGPALAGLGALAVHPQPTNSYKPGYIAPPMDGGCIACAVWAAPTMVWSTSQELVFAAGADIAQMLTSDRNSQGTAGLHADVLAQLIRGVPLWEAVSAAETQRLSMGNPDATPVAVRRAIHAAMFLTRDGMRPDALALDAEFDIDDKPGELGIALAAVASAGSFSDAVLSAVNQSADSCVTGALAGQLAGAVYGPDEIPVHWLDELELRGILETLCEDATEAFAPPPPPPPLPKWAQRYVGGEHLGFSGPLELPGETVEPVSLADEPLVVTAESAGPADDVAGLPANQSIVDAYEVPSPPAEPAADAPESLTEVPESFAEVPVETTTLTPVLDDPLALAADSADVEQDGEPGDEMSIVDNAEDVPRLAETTVIMEAVPSDPTFPEPVQQEQLLASGSESETGFKPFADTTTESEPVEAAPADDAAVHRATRLAPAFGGRRAKTPEREHGFAADGERAGDAETAPISLTERVLGMFLCGALGDSLGSDLEFVSADEITERFGPDGPQGLREAYGVRGAITDDTQMTLFTAEGLIRASVAQRTLAADDPIPEVQLAYQRWLHTQGVDWDAAAGPFLGTYPAPDGWLVGVRGLFSTRAPGKTIFRALDRFGRGYPAGSLTSKINDSKGCGGVMRAAPVALCSSDPAEVFELAARTAALTHSHPGGYLPAGAFAVIVQQALLGQGLDDGVWLALQVLETWEEHEETSTALKAAVDLAYQGMPSPAQVEEALGGGWVGEQALAIAVCAALVGGSDVEAALRVAVHHSGDSDSTGAICGNIVGALTGVGALPVSWLAELELREVIQQVALDCVAEFGVGEFLGTRPDAEDTGSADEEWSARYPVHALKLPEEEPEAPVPAPPPAPEPPSGEHAVESPTWLIPVVNAEAEPKSLQQRETAQADKKPEPAELAPEKAAEAAPEWAARGRVEMEQSTVDLGEIQRKDHYGSPEHSPKPAPRRFNGVVTNDA